MSIAARRVFWLRTKTLTLCLLATWLLVNLAVPWFARDLSAWRAFGFPMGYWMAAEGSLLIYLALIVIYVLAMEKLEAAYLDAAEPAGAQRAVPEPQPPHV